MKTFYTHYDNLGVSHNAPDDVIKAAYRTLSKKHHPDLNPGNLDAPGKMKSINESYDILCDPLKRKLYDEWLRQQDLAFGKRSHEPRKSWQPGQVHAYRIKARSFRKKFILASGALLLTGAIAAGMYAPVRQYLAYYGSEDVSAGSESSGRPPASPLPAVIDPETAIIPAGFRGDDIAALFSRALGSFPPKDEFEKLEEYQARFKSSAYHKQHFFSSSLARVSSYDLEKEIISIRFNDESDPGRKMQVIVESRTSFSSLDNTGKGVPEITNYYLKDIRKKGGIAHSLKSALNFRISPGEGRELKKHLGILIVATPAADSRGMVVSENRANEYEIFYQLNRKITNKYVHALINSVWVYNTETGAVHYKKLFPQPVPSETRSLTKKQSARKRDKARLYERKQERESWRTEEWSPVQ
jgi:curved DNA-binding protein CbpA